MTWTAAPILLSFVLESLVICLEGRMTGNMTVPCWKEVVRVLIDKNTGAFISMIKGYCY